MPGTDGNYNCTECRQLGMDKVRRCGGEGESTAPIAVALRRGGRSYFDECPVTALGNWRENCSMLILESLALPEHLPREGGRNAQTALELGSAMAASMVRREVSPLG